MIEIIAIIISAISLIITIVNQINIIKDKDPQLCFSLKNFDGILYLMVTNNGGTKAKNIQIKIDKIYNNGNCGIQEDQIFQIPFELASKESVQGMVSILGENISNHVFPYLDIVVKYSKSHFIKKVKYERQVFYTALSKSKINVDTNIDMRNIEHNINNIHKSALRLANYFDGSEIAPFDELNIVSQNHFQKDMLNIKNNKKSEINDREKCIKNRM